MVHIQLQAEAAAQAAVHTRLQAEAAVPVVVHTLLQAAAQVQEVVQAAARQTPEAGVQDKNNKNIKPHQINICLFLISGGLNTAKWKLYFAVYFLMHYSLSI